MRHAVLRGHAARAVPPRDIRRVALQRRPGRNVAERATRQCYCFVRVDIARDHQHRVRGSVILLEPRTRVVECRRLQVFLGADHFPRVRMVGGPCVLRDQPPSDAVGLVVTLPLLVQHHAALFIQPLLCQRAEQMAHTVRLHPQRESQRVTRHLLKIVSPVFTRGAVHTGGTNTLHRLEPIVVEVLAPVEHQVLKEVGKTGPPGTFVLRAHVIPDVHGHNGCLAVFMHNDGQAVFKNGRLIRYLHAHLLRRARAGRHRRRAQQCPAPRCSPHRVVALRLRTAGRQPAGACATVRGQSPARPGPRRSPAPPPSPRFVPRS